MGFLLISAKFWLSVTFFLFCIAIGILFRREIRESLLACKNIIADKFFVLELGLQKAKQVLLNARFDVESLVMKKQVELELRKKKIDDLTNLFLAKEKELRADYVELKAKNELIAKHKKKARDTQKILHKVFVGVEQKLSP